MSLRLSARFVLAISLCVALSAPAFAQYGGGGSGAGPPLETASEGGPSGRTLSTGLH